ncbi:MAG: sigma 54-dependent Fis family transcriptional regulator [Myxococcales bacterium]|nr:sigma 54-dependent Fis family transcriptional regulator [Myxococcales bacterium]
MTVRTLTDEAAETADPVEHVLTYVLAYDDLATDLTRTVRLPITSGELVIGRAPEGAPFGLAGGVLHVPDRWMSGTHATLSLHAGRASLRDAGSRNGTYVDGERITTRALRDGALIELGHSIACYRAVPASRVAALEAAAALRLGPTRTACPEVAALLVDLSRIAPSTESVLVLGETGAGKEIVAQTIHRASGRSGALISLDCGAIPDSLFEATLFGHRRGAFTGADEARTGEIVRANGGTLFLDEVGNLTPAAQAKLLRALETRRVTPLGSGDAQSVDVRWVAATNRELLADTAFRADLLRRLAGYVARVPPLRARREDLGILTAHVFSELGRARAAIASPAARTLFSSDFPGNIRELRSTLRSAALLAGDGPITSAHLPAIVGAPVAREPSRPVETKKPTATEIEQALAAAGGNVVHAAQALGTSARQLYRWIEKYEISVDHYRS